MSALTPAIQKAVGLVCLNEPASWIDHGVNQLIKDPVWTWGLILAKESQLSAPAVGTKWSIADQFIRPSPSLNEAAPTISFFQRSIKTFQNWSGSKPCLSERQCHPSSPGPSTQELDTVSGITGLQGSRRCQQAHLRKTKKAGSPVFA